MAEITQTLQFPQSKTRLHQQHRLPFSLYVLPHGTFYAVKRTHARTAHRTQCSASVRFVLLARLQERFHHSRSSHQTFFSSGADFLRGEKREKHKSEPWVQEGGPENPGTAPLGHEDPRKGETPPQKTQPTAPPHSPPPPPTPDPSARVQAHSPGPSAHRPAWSRRRCPPAWCCNRRAAAGRRRAGQGACRGPGCRGSVSVPGSSGPTWRRDAGCCCCGRPAACPPLPVQATPLPPRGAMGNGGGGCLRSWAGPKLLRAWPRGRRGPMRGRDVRSVVQ